MVYVMREQISAYLVKPPGVEESFAAIRSLKEVWFHLAALPPRHDIAEWAFCLISSTQPSATATGRWGARSGDYSVHADIRSMSRAADTSTCPSRKSGDQSNRATLWVP
jgi:hypothetical protein